MAPRKLLRARISSFLAVKRLNWIAVACEVVLRRQKNVNIFKFVARFVACSTFGAGLALRGRYAGSSREHVRVAAAGFEASERARSLPVTEISLT